MESLGLVPISTIFILEAKIKQIQFIEKTPEHSIIFGGYFHENIIKTQIRRVALRF